MLKYILLGFLDYQPMSGYELKQHIDSSTTFFWHAELSQIYRTLKSLENDGAITSHIEPQEDRPDRRVYTITPVGQTTLKVWLFEPEQNIIYKKDTLLLKLFFAARGGVERDMLLAQMRTLRHLYQQQLEYFETYIPQVIEQNLAEHPDWRIDGLLWDATRRFGVMYTEMYVRWLEEVIGLIETEL